MACRSGALRVCTTLDFAILNRALCRATADEGMPMSMKRSYVMLLVAAVLALGCGAGAPPAAAQVIKPGGIPIPSFFFPGAERRAREA